jgi:hypothetical protein
MAAAIGAAKAGWPMAERAVPLIALQEENGAWAASARNPDGEAVRVWYSRTTGLFFN